MDTGPVGAGDQVKWSMKAIIATRKDRAMTADDSESGY
jgi:hypothetical protein